MSHQWKVGDRAKAVGQNARSIALWGSCIGKEGTVVATSGPFYHANTVGKWKPDADTRTWEIGDWNSLTPLLPPDETATDEAASLFVERIKRQVAQDMKAKVVEKEGAK